MYFCCICLPFWYNKSFKEKQNIEMEKIVYLISFLLSSSNYVVNLSIPLYLISKFSASPLILGIAGFFGNFAYTLFTYLFHRFKYKIHFPHFIISSILISSVYFLLPFVPSYFLFFFILFLNGIFYSRFWPSIQYFFSNNPENTDRYNLSWASGVIFGIFISGYLFKMNEILPFFIGSFLAFSGFILGRINLEKFKKLYEILPEKFLIEKKIDKETKRSMFLNFINFFCIGGVIFLFPKLARTISYSPGLISNIMTSLFLIRFLMFYFFSKVKFEIKDDFLLIYILDFISLLLTGIFRKPFLHLISISILGITSALSYRIALINVIEKGYSTELNESIIGIGLFAGPLIVGILSQISGIFNGFIISGFLVLFISVFMELFLQK